MRTKNGAFTSLQGFCDAMCAKSTNRRAIESLIKSGAMDCLGLNRRMMLENFEKFLESSTADFNRAIEGQMSFFGGTQEYYAPKIDYVDEYPIETLLQFEKEVTGMYISGHPILKYKPFMSSMRIPEIADIVRGYDAASKIYDDKTACVVLGSQYSLRKHSARSGAQMCFLGIEDNTDQIECVVFPKIYEKCYNAFENGKTFIVKGKVSVKESYTDNESRQASVIVDEIYAQEDFDKFFADKRICININSTDEEAKNDALEICSRYTGNSALTFWFGDIKKQVRLKSQTGVDICLELCTELINRFGAQNVAIL